MKRLWQRPLAREITIVLAVKVVLIIALKLAFFSDAEEPGSEGTARALLSTPSTPIPTATPTEADRRPEP